MVFLGQIPECDSSSEDCAWQDVEEYYPAGLGDPIDESIQESFPASDPPSFSPEVLRLLTRSEKKIPRQKIRPGRGRRS